MTDKVDWGVWKHLSKYERVINQATGAEKFLQYIV